MKYGYIRVSTTKQAKDGNSLMAQQHLIDDEMPEETFIDAYTGTKMERPELDKLLSIVEPGDTIIVTKLDRLARNAVEGVNLIEDLVNNKHVKVHILNMGKVDWTPNGKLILTILLAFAEFERDMIVERTREGREIARTKPGYKEGRPKKYSKKQIEHALELLEDHSYSQVAELTGISTATLTRAKKAARMASDNV